MLKIFAALWLCLSLALPARAAVPESIFLGALTRSGYESALTEIAFEDGYKALRAGQFSDWVFAFDHGGIHARLVNDLDDTERWSYGALGVFLEPTGYLNGLPLLRCRTFECPERVTSVSSYLFPFGEAGTDKVIVPFAVVPEPGAVGLMGVGLLLLMAARRASNALRAQPLKMQIC